ncbi:hypothetical protein GF380_01525 [Candidatus Uhrbacteria bacterium]|nr:hypothetical protein [Candidatus Uhrbacteria bacterium]
MIMLRQHYKSSVGTGTNYIDVLPKTLTLRPAFTAKRFDRRGITLFKEVNVVPPQALYTDAIRDTLACKHTIFELRAQFLKRLCQELKRVILTTWVPGTAHAVLHSSGLDSRMLSWTIRELWREHGDDWLGQVVFLCSKWEAESFNAQMQYEGWSKDQYWAVDADKPKQRYYEWSISDFSGAWQRANGASAIPVNLFWYLVARAQETGRLPASVQTYSGQWGNTVMDATNAEAVRQQQVRFYYSVLRQRPFKGDSVVLPFANERFVRAVLSSKIVLGHKLRPLLLASMDERLASFPNMASDGDRHRRIANDLIQKMIRDYDNSWYGKHVRPGAKPQWKTTEFQPFWSRWTAASLCEHLRKEGHTIRW